MPKLFLSLLLVLACLMQVQAQIPDAPAATQSAAVAVASTAAADTVSAVRKLFQQADSKTISESKKRRQAFRGIRRNWGGRNRNCSGYTS